MHSPIWNVEVSSVQYKAWTKITNNKRLPTPPNSPKHLSLPKPVQFHHREIPLMSCTSLLKAVKLVWTGNWLDCPAKWYTSSFIMCIILQVKLTVRFCYLPPTPTLFLDDVLRGIQWMYRGKQCLPLCRLSQILATLEGTCLKLITVKNFTFTFSFNSKVPQGN